MSDWTLCRFGSDGKPYNDPVTNRSLPMDEIESLEQDNVAVLLLNSKHIVHVRWKVGRDDDTEWIYVRS